MAQEDYLSGSKVGQVYGSLLAGRKKTNKKERNKALLATVIFESLGALQKNQKQNIVDGANAVKEKYNDIFKLNEADFASAEGDRKLLKRYIDSEETFLNDEVKKVINNTDEVSAARVTWDDVDKQPKELRDSMYAAYNEERKKLINKMEALKVDPRATTQNFERFNKAAKEEYLAALKLVEDDPTKKGLLKAAWNRIFKTKREGGELVTTNETLIKLQSDLVKAKEDRTTFRDRIDNQVVQEQLYTPLVFKNKEINRDAMYSVGIKKLNELTNGDEIYANVDSEYFKELLDQTAEENPNFTETQIIDRAYTLTLTKEVDPAPYLTRQGAKEANGRLLVDNWKKLKTEKERRQFFDNDPTKLYQLGDALKLEGFATEAAGLLTDYKDIYEQTKAYQPTTQEVTRYVQKFRNTLDSNNKQDKQIINDDNYVSIVGGNAALAANYFRVNNKNWADNYTENEIEDAALNFVLSNTSNNNSTETRMLEVDLLDKRLNINSKEFSESILEDTPKFISELKSANRGEDVLELRNKYQKFAQTGKNLQLDLDERAELSQKIDNIFKDAGVSLGDNAEGNTYSSPLAQMQSSLSEVDFNPMPLDGGYYLKNADKLVAEMDLNSLSEGQLLTLRLNTMPGNVGRNSQLPFKLGLPSDISLDSRKTSGLGPLPDIGDLFAKDKVRVQLRNRIKSELDKRDYSGRIQMARKEDFEEIPDEWWAQYMIENPTGVVNTRGLTRGSKYNQPKPNQSAVVPDEPAEVKKKSLLSSTEPQEQVTNGLTFAESSNNPDALWKQSQKETFKNFTPTQSTLKEVLEFTKFDGEYADWSRQQGQNKTTHTPVGKYQFVGATLRDIKKRGGLDDLNITDNTIFTEQVQDKLFEWYIKDTIKSVGTNATQEDKRKKIRVRFEGATTENVSNEELDLIIEQILADSYSSNINQG